MLFGGIQSFLKMGKGEGLDLKPACLSLETILGRRFPKIVGGPRFGVFDDKKRGSIFSEFDSGYVFGAFSDRL